VRGLPLPTALGWKALAFYAALTGAFFAAPYSNLYFLLLAFLTVLGGLSFIWSAGNVHGVTAEIEDLAPVPAGAGQRFHARIRTGTKRRFQLGCTLRVAGVGDVSARCAMVEGDVLAEGGIPALERGIYPITRACVESSYPFGVLRGRTRVDAPAELVVFPAPADLPEARNGGDLVAGLTGILGGVEGTQQPSSLREYHTGDELRSIHWRATARRGRPVVIEWEGEAGNGLEVALDRRTEPDALEGALSLISALALASKDNKERLTLHSQDISRTFGTGCAPWPDLLRFLAAATPLPADGPAPPPVSPSILRLPLPAGARG